VKPDVTALFDAPTNTISYVVKDPAKTHRHADDLSAAPFIQGKLGGNIGIGEQITVVQEVVGKLFNEGTECRGDGR
jgi:hypothetical protein